MLRIKTRQKCKAVKIKKSNNNNSCENVRKECLKRVSRSSAEHRRRSGGIMLNESAHIKKCEKAFIKCKKRS